VSTWVKSIPRLAITKLAANAPENGKPFQSSEVFTARDRKERKRLKPWTNRSGFFQSLEGSVFIFFLKTSVKRLGGGLFSGHGKV
jgi:hypothetical protein